MKKALTLTVLMVLTFAPTARAAKHPVTLEANVDAAKCVECHGDKTKGKAVHSAMATGCLSCHEVRTSKDVTRIKLITTTPAALCVTCHADKKAADLKGRVHSPAVRDCLTCHDPHTSDNKNQLKKAVSGDSKNDNLCLTCHDKGMNVPKDGSRHAALDMGCDTCHVTHKTGDKSKVEFAYHLAKGTPDLCLDCHDVKDEALKKAHRNQPFEKADCITCHDPHQSASPKLMAKFQHPPFADKSCETCHEAAKDGKVVLTQESSRALCVTCHDDKAKLIETAKVQHPGAAGDCTDCHNPHASKSPGLPKTTSVDICLTCHSDLAEQGQKAHPHQPVFEQGCATCHEPHGSANQKLLRTADTNSLCLECHSPQARPEIAQDTHTATIFNGQVRLPEDYFRKVPRLALRYGRGHPVDGHPIAPVPGSTIKNADKIACLTCHQPHSSAQPNLLVKDQANNTAFCNTCHAQAGGQ